MKHITMFDTDKYSETKVMDCIYRNYTDQVRHQPDEDAFAESLFDVTDLPLVTDDHEFLFNLVSLGITEFAITCRTTNLIEHLTEMEKSGWVIVGTTKVLRKFVGKFYDEEYGLHIRFQGLPVKDEEEEK